MRALLAGILSLACSCGSPQLSVSAEGPLAEATRIGMYEWNTGLLRGPCPEVLLSDSISGEPDITVSPGRALGHPAMAVGREITVDLSLHKSQAALNVSVAHEIGHALGSGHSMFDSDLMYFAPKVARGPAPSGFDVARVCAAWWGKSP
jgi:hypothetical protein